MWCSIPVMDAAMVLILSATMQSHTTSQQKNTLSMKIASDIMRVSAAYGMSGMDTGKSGATGKILAVGNLSMNGITR